MRCATIDWRGGNGFDVDRVSTVVFGELYGFGCAFAGEDVRTV